MQEWYSNNPSLRWWNMELGGGGGGGGTFHFYDVKNCSFKRKYQIDIGTVRNKFSSRDTIMWVKVCIIVNKNVCKISVYTQLGGNKLFMTCSCNYNCLLMLNLFPMKFMHLNFINCFINTRRRVRCFCYT